MKLVEVVVWDDCDIRTFLFGMIVTSEHWGGFPTNWEESLVRPKLVTNRDKLLLQQSKMSTLEFTICIDVPFSFSFM